jgi:CheY-like chemotaxis protein
MNSTSDNKSGSTQKQEKQNNRSGLKVFIVDDDDFSSNMYWQFLKHNGFPNVDIINDGEKCLAKLSEHPDIIFLDHQMTEMSGMETLQKIKKYDPHIKVVIVSGQENIRMAVSFIKQGAFDYIVKGDDEMLRMKTILKKLGTDEKEGGSLATSGISGFAKNIGITSFVAVLLLIVQCGLVVYYYMNNIYMILLGVSMLVLSLLYYRNYRAVRHLQQAGQL